MPIPLATRIALWIWLLAALAVGRIEWLARIPPPAIQGLVLTLTIGLVAVYRLAGSFRAWVDSLDLRAIVSFHVTRFVGIYFLLLYRRGDLPYAFAVPGGIGDILVAVFALAVVFVPLSAPAQRRAIYFWNVFGLVDILLVVVTALRIGAAGHGYELAELTRLPLSLLPTFLVPLIIASHIAIFARLARPSEK